MSLFITFEGPDGSGKSTQVARLAERLRALGLDVCLAREPGGTAIGDQIRAVLHDLQNTAMQPRAEILLYSASRAQIVGELIRPQLERGGVVLCDRYADSTMAYQGYGHGLDLDVLRTITDFATGGLKPDLTLLLDLDVEDGLKRRKSGGEWNRLDAYSSAFHQRVREGYHQLAAADLGRWVVIDASGEAEKVADAVWQAAKKKLEIGD